MSTYLELCNKVIQESANELTELTLANWATDPTGRRVYPRIKRAVAEAWKMIQIDRYEWEFKSAELFVQLHPRFKVQGGAAIAAPAVGARYKGTQSGFEFTVQKIITKSGDWSLGTWEGQLELAPNYDGTTPIPTEIFKEVTPTADNSSFMYVQKGSYDMTEFDPLLREIMWETFVAQQGSTTPIPVLSIPWNNWLYKDLSFTQGSRTVPSYMSEDFEGNIVFYPQTLDPFFISFTYTRAPQILSDPNDVPALLKEEFHDWIAWQALYNYALYDKNTNLANYAKQHADFYSRRAERQLLPRIEWGENHFDREY